MGVRSGLSPSNQQLFFLWLTLRLIRFLKKACRKSAEIDSVLLLGTAMALLAFAVHGVVDYFLGFTPIYVMVWMSLGVAATLGRGLTRSRDPIR